MSMITPTVERRVDRSPYLDQALEKLLNRIRLDHAMSALVLADEEGHLVAVSGVRAESELADLGALSAEIGRRLSGWPGFHPPERLYAAARDGEAHLMIHFFQAAETWLALTVAGPHIAPDSVLERAEEGVRRILGG